MQKVHWLLFGAADLKKEQKGASRMVQQGSAEKKGLVGEKKPGSEKVRDTRKERWKEGIAPKKCDEEGKNVEHTKEEKIIF